MLAYEPDTTLAHRLDPRSKLAFQMGFAVAALARTTPSALAVLTVVTALVLMAARVSLFRALYAYRFALLLLGIAPLISMLVLGPPWIDPVAGIVPALASYRVLLILLVSAAYVRSTTVRDSRVAIQRTVPGKTGQLLGIGVALVFRFLPVIWRDLRTIRDASSARLGDQRSLVDRMGRLGTLGLGQAFRRADRLALALEARCFAWNPTLPRLSCSRLDFPIFVVALFLFLSPLL